MSKVYNVNKENIGEIWGISAHKSNSNMILDSKFSGISFREFYKSHRSYFGYYAKDEFPLLFKIIDASDDLSVQVHPNDDYAKAHEKSYGKAECWYILETVNETEKIVIGHNAKSRSELLTSIKSDKIKEILVYHKIKKGDYFYIPSGKVHAICNNTTLLEVSQSSDITYRLYDYNRLDHGKLRPLHIKKSLDVISIPDTPNQRKHKDEFFSFDIIENGGNMTTADIYGDYIYIINGNGYVNEKKVTSGEFIMITSNSQYRFSGKIKYALINIK